MQYKRFNVRAFTLVEIITVVAIIGLVTAIAIPNFVKSRQVARRNICLANMKKMEEAIQTKLALESSVSTPSSMNHAELEVFLVPDYLKAMPRCPDAGTYSSAVSQSSPGSLDVFCSKHNPAP